MKNLKRRDEHCSGQLGHIMQWEWDDDDGNSVNAACDEAGWIHIDTMLPPTGQRVLHCCYMDLQHGFTDPYVSEWSGGWTKGRAIVMENEDNEDDFYPCDRWQFVVTPKDPR